MYDVIYRYYLFLLINGLLTFSIAGTVLNSLIEIITDPTGIPNKLASTLPRVNYYSNFFEILIYIYIHITNSYLLTDIKNDIN